MQGQMDIDKKYENYRNSGIAFSVTLTSLSTALIIWGYKVLTDITVPINLYRKTIIIFQIIFFAVTILLCLCIQFCNYEGYKCYARTFSGQSSSEKANLWFDKGDWSVRLAIILFIIALFFSILTFSFVLCGMRS